MKKAPRLSPSGIEYLDYSWGLYSGCRNKKLGICPPFNCWAETTIKRFKSHYPNGFEPTYYPEAFLSPIHLKKPSKIGVGWMGDLFGDWVDPDKKFPLENGYNTLKEIIFSVARQCPQHTFLFLTKCPWNLPKWGKFPDNCGAGATVCDDGMMTLALTNLANVQVGFRYLSIEPLLGYITMKSHPMKGIIDWVIIGAMTCAGGELARLAAQFPQLTPMPYGGRYTLQPKIEWVEEIIKAADTANIPIFLKNNFKPLFTTLTLEEALKARILDDFTIDTEHPERNFVKIRQEIPAVQREQGDG